MFGTKEPGISRKLFIIGTPIIVQYLVQYVQLQVDMAMLGHYNPVLLSAVGNVLFPYNVYISFLMSISLGSTILISHSLGANDIYRAQRYGEVSFFYNVLVSLLFFLNIFFAAFPMLGLMGIPAEIHSPAAGYFQILSFSFLLLGVEYSITAALQGMGITRHIMYAGILRTAINVVLDWAMIFGYLGFPEMGIDGAAWATTISNFAAAGYFILAFIKSKNLVFNFSLKGILKPDWKYQKENIKVGVPSGLESILWSFGQIGIITIVNELDVYSSGLYVLVGRIQAFTVFIYMGIARATMILVGQKLGAGKNKEAISIGLQALKYTFILCAFIAVLFISIPEQILSVFTSDMNLVKRVSYLMYLVSFTIFPVAVNIIAGAVIRGMKDTKWMFYTQAFGTIFIISMSAVMIFIFHFNLLGIFLTVMMDECVRGTLNYLRFVKGREFFTNIFRGKESYYEEPG